MEVICLSCHGTDWVRGHFERYDRSHETTNAATLVATEILQEIWSGGHAEGPPTGSLFDEAIEHRWGNAWLFYANSIRFTTAMAGGGDYAVFADGHYALSRIVQELHEWLELRRRLE